MREAFLGVFSHSKETLEQVGRSVPQQVLEQVRKQVPEQVLKQVRRKFWSRVSE